MSRVRHRSRAELPPSPIEFAYPLAIPGATVLGAVILEEVPPDFALHVFQALRFTFAWAAGPLASGEEFDMSNLGEWEAEVLQTQGTDEALWAPVSVIAGELARPAELELDRLSYACLAVMDWALGHEAFGTAVLFAEAAAVVWPTNARLAWLCGKVCRERQDFGRAEMWLRRAKRVARWTGDWEIQARAINSLGNMKVYVGDHAGGRELLLSAARLARRRRLRERHAMVLHDLLVVSIYTEAWSEGESYGERAFVLYGPDHPNIMSLTFDLAYLSIHQGQFARAIEVLNQLGSRFTCDDRKLRVYAAIARAAGVVGDAEAFHHAWANSWVLIDGGTVDHLRADAAFEVGMGAVSVGFRDLAEQALRVARDAARDLLEQDTFEKAESALGKLEYHEAAAVAQRNRPGVRSRAADLATKYVQLLPAPA